MGQAVRDVVFEVRGEVPEGAGELARARVAQACERAPEPVLFARVKLTMIVDPAVSRPALAQANVDVNGRLVRIQAAAESMWQAITLLEDRLLLRLGRLGRHWEAIRGHAPGEGRHGREPAHYPDFYQRPREDRKIVRRKTFESEVATPDEAAFDMDALDYGFHLFIDVETGQDSVLYRSDDSYRLAQLDPQERKEPVAVPLTVSPLEAARLSVPEAVARLEGLGLPFVFFADSATGRGNVLYHRYDGHYGLVTPRDVILERS